MTSITSQHNPRLKELRKLHRRRERERSGLFLAEGEDLIAAALAAGRGAVRGYRAVGSAIGGAGFEDVDPDALSSVSTLGSGTRAIGVYEQCFLQPVGPLCVYLHGVGDPGNVGTVLRSAAAFGASSVALGPGCADPHSPKAVRASMGAIFQVPLARARDASELPGERCALVAGAGEPLWGVRENLTAEGSAAVGEVIAAGDDARARVRARDASFMEHEPPEPPAPTEHEPPAPPEHEPPAPPEHEPPALTEHEPPAPPKHEPPAFTLLVGAEREGLPQELVAACERVVHIPIALESLNAAMAATVALYELTRPSTRVPTS